MNTVSRRNFLAAVGVLACSVGALAAKDREPLNYIYDNDLRHNYVTDNFVTENELTGWRHTTGAEMPKPSPKRAVPPKVSHAPIPEVVRKVEVPHIDIFEPGAYRKLDRIWLNWATKRRQ